MRILPVIDLLAGDVVRGIAGRREDYRPLRSQLVHSSAPLEVARAFRERFALTELYVADLDALAGKPPDLETYRTLREDGFRLWIDAGVSSTDEGSKLAEQGAVRVIVALETMTHWKCLESLIVKLGPERVVFSLDLREDRPMGKMSVDSTNPLVIAQEAVASGATQILVLDVARVGMAGGTGTVSLCADIKRCCPHVEIAAGGGVRGLTDLLRLGDAGITTALVASALHDGGLTRRDLELIA